MGGAMTEDCATVDDATRPRFFGLPRTALGWAAPALMVACFAAAIFGERLGLDARPLNLALLLASMAAGVAAVVARRERSWLVWLPVAFVAATLFGEVLQGIGALLGSGA